MFPLPSLSFTTPPHCPLVVADAGPLLGDVRLAVLLVGAEADHLPSATQQKLSCSRLIEEVSFR